MARFGRTSQKWDALTPAYRQRLSRHGVTRETYLSGANLKAARGHRVTPENRAEVARHPERFTRYTDQLDGMRAEAIANLRFQIGHGFANGSVDQFSIFTIQERVAVAPRDVLVDMRIAELDEIQERASRDAEMVVVFIDGILQRTNLWWYH